MKYAVINLILILLAINVVEAATLQGSIFDFSLEPLSDAVIEIDTEPKQIKVAKDGKY